MARKITRQDMRDAAAKYAIDDVNAAPVGETGGDS